MLLPAATHKTILSTRSALLLRSRISSWFWTVTAVLAVIALPLIYLQGQEPTSDDEVVKVSTDLLVFPIRIRDKRGQAATTLTERDLLLKDNDHVTSGLYLYPGADRVALVFALDQSGSLREIVSQQREAALALFGRFG